MAIVPYRENPNHVDSERPHVAANEPALIGECTSDLWWWEPTKKDLEQHRREYEERLARKIPIGFTRSSDA